MGKIRYFRNTRTGKELALAVEGAHGVLLSEFNKETGAIKRGSTASHFKSHTDLRNNWQEFDFDPTGKSNYPFSELLPEIDKNQIMANLLCDNTYSNDTKYQEFQKSYNNLDREIKDHLLEGLLTGVINARKNK